MWILVIVMLSGQSYQWPERYPSRAACEAAGRDLLEHQDEVVLIEGAACQPAGRSG